MEVWQGETCNLDFLSEFEFMKSAEENAANNHAVSVHSSFPSQQAIMTQPVVPLQTSETPLQTSQEDSNAKLDCSLPQQTIDNNTIPLDFPQKDQPFPWHKFIEELNQYNWQQDEENRVKLLFSQIDQEVDTKATLASDNASVQNTQWNSNNEIKLQLKMESNLVASSTYGQDYVNSLPTKSNASFAVEQGAKVKTSVKQETLGVAEESLMEIDEVCSELGTHSKELEVGINMNVHGDGKIAKTDPQWQNNILPVDAVPLPTHDDALHNIPDQMKEWKILWQRTLDINELRQPEDCGNPTWQLIDCMDNTGKEGIEFILSQLGANPILTEGMPIEGDAEEGREQSLPDWNTAFGHKKHASLPSTDVPPQVCDMFVSTEGQPVLTDLTPAPTQPQYGIEAAAPAGNLPETSENMISSIISATSQQIEATSSVITLQPAVGVNLNIIVPIDNENVLLIPDSVNFESPKKQEKQNNNKKTKSNKKSVEKACQVCGKFIKNLTRHMLRVHKFQKVNGEFVPLVIPSYVDNSKKNIDIRNDNNNSNNTLESDIKCYVKTIIEKTKIDLNIGTTCESINVNEQSTQDSNSSTGNGSNNTTTTTNDNNICICALCSKGYKSKTSIAKHLQTVHKIGKKLLKCSDCCYTTVFNYTMNYHMIRHTQIPPLLCYFCQHEYRSRSCLIRHISVNHSQEMMTVFGGKSKLEYIEVAKLSKNVKFEDLIEKYKFKKIRSVKDIEYLPSSSPKVHDKAVDLSAIPLPSATVISRVKGCPPPLVAIQKPATQTPTPLVSIQKSCTLKLSPSETIALLPSISCATKRQTLTLPITPGSEFTVTESKQRSLILPPTFDSKVTTITPLSKSTVNRKSSLPSNRLVLSSIPSSKKRRKSTSTSCSTSSSNINTFKLPSPVTTECKAQDTISLPCIPVISKQENILSQTFPSSSFIAPHATTNPLNMDFSQIENVNVNSLQSPDSTCQNDDVSLQVVPSTSSDNTVFNEPLYLYMPASQPSQNDIEFLSPILNESVKDNNLNYPIDYSNKQLNMLPVSPLSPNSSSPSLVPNSENSSNYNNNSEIEITETDSQNSSIRYNNNLEEMSFSSTEPSSNQNSIDETNLPILANNNNNVNKIIKNVPVNNNNNNKKYIDIPCTQCHKVFHSKQNLRSHIKNIHESTEKIYSCSMCSYKGANKTYLKRHTKIHEKFACKLCSKKFVDEFLLQNHELTEHNNDKNEVDEEQLLLLLPNTEVKNNIEESQEHQDNIINTNNIIGMTVDNLYSCHSCDDVQFEDQYLMFTHVYTSHLYSNEVSLQCLLCNKTLKQKQYLKRHLKNVHKMIFS